MVGLPLPYQIARGYLAMALNGNRLTHFLFAEVVPCGHKPTAVEVGGAGMKQDADEILEIYRKLRNCNCRVGMELDYGARPLDR